MITAIKTKSIITFIIFMSSYTHAMICSEELLSRERKMNPDQLEQREHRLTPLHLVETVEQAADILKYGPDINAQDIHGFTPLQYMIENGNVGVAIYLVEQGAKTNIDDKIAYAKLTKKNCIFKKR